MTRVSKRRIEELDRLVSERDKAALLSLEVCRYMHSGQIQRLHFTEHANPTAALRATNRSMKKLQEYGLIDALDRRIGYAIGGSGSYVWLLTEAGRKLLHLNDSEYRPRKKFEPSTHFIKHTLATTEAYVQITEMCKEYRLEQMLCEIEPACWRSYTGEDGKPATIKPDLFAILANDSYEDIWFVEIDMATQSPCVILDKCARYGQYYRDCEIKKQYGIYPYVVFVVPNEKRKERLQAVIAESKQLRFKNIFIVITPEEFKPLLLSGAEPPTETKGEQHDNSN